MDTKQFRAKRYKTTPQQVERNMREKAIQHVRDERARRLAFIDVKLKGHET